MSDTPNGPAFAAILAAAIGAFAMGLFVILNEAGIYSAPALIAPVGGLAGRALFSVVVWLVAWVVLHAQWRAKDVNETRIATIAAVLAVVGLVAVFPPVWGLL